MNIGQYDLRINRAQWRTGVCLAIDSGGGWQFVIFEMAAALVVVQRLVELGRAHTKTCWIASSTGTCLFRIRSK
jgi:hypothetical protein